LLLVAATVIVIGVFVAFGGGGAHPNDATTSTASASTAAPSVASSAPVATEIAPTPPTASAVAPPPTAATNAASVPLPPGDVVAGKPSVAPSDTGGPVKNSITPDWQAKKTEQALAAVQTRHDQVQAEIAELQKAGKTQEAADKTLLLKRLDKQMADMKNEIAAYKAAAAGDAGAIDAAPE
jgi:hypothetical protein